VQTRTNDNSTSVIPKENLQSAANNNTIKGVLTRVYKFFMVSFGKDRTPVWNKLMDNFINDPNNGIPHSRNKQTSAKGNMKREYLGSQLSWPKFAEAMKFAKFSKLEIIFIATDENGQRMKMVEELNFDNMKDSDFDFNFLSSVVQNVADDEVVEEALETTDAKVQANNLLQKGSSKNGLSPSNTKGRDWVNRPAKDIQDIINNNIVKEE
jgi:hypothetical protein